MVTNEMDIISGWESPGDVERSEAGELGKCHMSLPSSHILMEAPLSETGCRSINATLYMLT